jgi:hypothetical protein
MKRKQWVGLLCLLLFGLLIALAVYKQSAYILYAASLLPIVIVPLLPDIRTNQKVNPAKNNRFRIFTTAAEDGTVPDFIVIEFVPGSIQWNKQLLYFPADRLPFAAKGKSLDDGLSIPVLGFDLVRHPRKRKWLGIRLRHLVQRNAGFSFTLREVTRLIIPYAEVQPFVNPSFDESVTSTGKGLQA